ncbi:MAG TPA: hypothetical protein VF516_27170 [Kofleriaceae bacterium]
MVMRIARLQDHERNEAFTRLQESIKDLPSGEAQRVLSEIVDRDLINEADHETWFGISKVLTHDEAQASSSLSGACMRAIFDAALTRARSARGRELSFWSTLIDVAESAAVHIENRHRRRSAPEPGCGGERIHESQLTAASWWR